MKRGRDGRGGWPARGGRPASGRTSASPWHGRAESNRGRLATSACLLGLALTAGCQQGLLPTAGAGNGGRSSALAAGVRVANDSSAAATDGLRAGSQSNGQAAEGVLTGRVEFPGRRISAAAPELLDRATVSLLAPDGQTVAATVTGSGGTFSLGLGSFVPTAGVFYTVEAMKTVGAGEGGSRVLRLRTLARWNGTSWLSCSGAGTVQINTLTTTVALIRALRPDDVTGEETIGVVSGSGVSSANPAIASHWERLADLVADLLARDNDPVARIAYEGGTFLATGDRGTLLAPNMAVGSHSGTVYMLDGSVQLSGALPRPNWNDETTFSSGLSATGLVVTDGTYLYVRPWGNAGAFRKIGTGFNGTTAGASFGTYSTSMASALTAGYYGGYIYQLNTPGFGTLQRLNVGNGAVDTVGLSVPALPRSPGESQGYFFTDGDYFYNVTYTVGGAGYFNGFTLRVYDPRNDFAFVRSLALDAANTPLANTSFYADGVLADGKYVFMMEWIGGAGGAARMRRYRLEDGQLETEYQFSQLGGSSPNDPIHGCYDWVNNKYWFGNYASGLIHRTAGRTFPASGTWVSAPMDAGSAVPVYGRIRWNAAVAPGESVSFRVRTADSKAGLAQATFVGPTSAADSYTTSGAALGANLGRKRWLQLQATLTPSTSANTTPRLYGATVEVLR